MEYRKRKGSDTWHWSADCFHWPAINYDCKFRQPTHGQICEECKKTKKNQKLKLKQKL
jgi:hypothetical protein